MYKSITHLFIAVLCFFAIGLHAQKISIQSTLKDITGKAIPDGDVNVTFRLYHQLSGGSHVWEESTTVTVVGGIYSHKLGSIVPLNAGNFGNTLFLGVTVSGGQELAPRTELTSAPYAVSVSSLAANGGSASFDGNGVFTVPGQFGTIKTNGNIGVGWNSNPTWHLSIPGNAGFHQYGNRASLVNNNQIKMSMWDNGTISFDSPSNTEISSWIGGVQKFKCDDSGTVTSGRHHVFGDVNLSGSVNPSGSVNIPYNQWVRLGDSDSGITSPGDGMVQLMSNTLPVITVRDWNRVGINNVNPTATFHVSGPTVDGYSNNYVGFSHFSGGGLTSYENNNNQALGNAENTNDIVAYFEGGVVSNLSFYAAVNNNFSDIRTKSIRGRSNSEKDLSLLNKVKITDYTMIDNVKDNKLYKKVIAQEIKEIFPQAIATTRNIIPNILCPAKNTKFDSKKLTITLDKPHQLTANDHIDLLAKEAKLTDIKVLNIVDDFTFEVESEINLSSIFIYGKYVNDFLSVDYDAISMLNVSATQELYKKIMDLENENKALKTNTTNLEERMARIEAMIGNDAQKSQITNTLAGQK